MSARRAGVVSRVICGVLALAGAWAVGQLGWVALRDGNATLLALLPLAVAVYGLYLFGFIAITGRLPRRFDKAAKSPGATSD